MIPYVWLVLFFPLIGFVINGLYGKRFPKNLVGAIGAGVIGLSFAVLSASASRNACHLFPSRTATR